MKLVNVHVGFMQVLETINKGGIMININVNPKNWLTKKYVIKDLFGNQVILNVNVMNHATVEKG